MHDRRVLSRQLEGRDYVEQDPQPLDLSKRPRAIRPISIWQSKYFFVNLLHRKLRSEIRQYLVVSQSRLCMDVQ